MVQQNPAAMTRPLIPRNLVAEHLAISTTALVRYEKLGLVRVSHEGQVEGYEPSEVRRIWTILSYQRDLGVNLAGVEVILRMRDTISELHHRLGTMAGELREILETEESAGAESSDVRSHAHD
jgi:MerR family transcriptional regulator/heat shock protein HspR